MSETLSAAECQAKIEQFTQVTKTDEALAQFYLQENDWNTAASIAVYYEQNTQSLNEKPTAKRSNTANILPAKRIKSGNTELFLPKKFSFISWNIDGISDKNIKERTLAVVNTIKVRKVDIVFLQEVIAETYEILEANLSADYLLTDNKAPEGADKKFYFTVTILRRSTLILDSIIVKPFSNSKMMRDLTVANVKFIDGTKLLLMNTHLESTKEFAEPRMAQLKQAFDIMVKNSDENKNTSIIFAGDLNTRDSEVQKVGIPKGIKDVWIALGERKECQYTWDSMRNTNSEIQGRFKPRCRFDRVYFKTSIQEDIKPEHFGLCGIEKVFRMQSFPSDHWGVYCIFDMTKSKI